MQIIMDGTGSNFKAKVNSDNQLETYSMAIDHLSYLSLSKKDCYIFDIDFKQQVANTDECGVVFTYTGNRNLIFSQFFMSTWDVDLTTFTFGMGFLYSSGGTLIIPTNANTTSSKSLSCICYSQNLTTPITLGYPGTNSLMFPIKGPGYLSFDAKSYFLIRPNLPFGLRIKCINADSLCKVTFLLAEVDISID